MFKVAVGIESLQAMLRVAGCSGTGKKGREEGVSPTL